MINSLTIENFQSHKKTELEFDKGVNVIVGPSDNGKSAILRALIWLIQNKPNNTDNIHSHWADNSTVKIDTNVGTIIRHRGKAKNYYQVDDLLLKAFGQKVPEEVSDILNINDLNIHRQLDGVFLFSKSSGEVARYLNKVINLDVIDSSLSNIASEKLKESSNLKSQQKNLEQYENELDEYKWIEDYEEKLEALEDLQKSLDEKEKRIYGLPTLIIQIQNNQDKLSKVNELLELETKVNELLELNETISDLKYNHNKFEVLVARIKSTNVKLKFCEVKIENSESIYNKHMSGKCPLCGRTNGRH